MAGSIVGVGFLALPYITMKVGILTMSVYFVVLTALVVFLHVMFAQISLKTPDHKRYPGFVGHHLGKKWEGVALALVIPGSFGVLLIYLVVAGQFLSAIFSPAFGGGPALYALLFFAAVALALSFNINIFSKIEFWALCLLSILFAIIFIKGSGHIDFNNFLVSDFKFGGADLFLPYGAILFSLWGTGLIPEVEEMNRGHKKSLKKIVIIATLLPAAMYALFIFLVLGITGPATTESALTGLKAFFNNGIMNLALGMGVVSIFMAFISQGMILKKTFVYDIGAREFPAWVFTCFVPLVLFLLGINSFISLISFMGGVFIGISGIFILLMYYKIGGKLIIICPLILFFIAGIIYELIYFF